ARMVDTGVLPAATKHQEHLARSVAAAEAAGLKVHAQKKALAAYASDVDDLLTARKALDTALAASRKHHHDPAAHARAISDGLRPALGALRTVADRLESSTDAALWPFPTYHQMLFQ